MGRLGIPELIVIFAILLLLFGANRLPQLGSSIGSAIRNFKKGFNTEEPVPPEEKKSVPAIAGSSGGAETKPAAKASSRADD